MKAGPLQPVPPMPASPSYLDLATDLLAWSYLDAQERLLVAAWRRSHGLTSEPKGGHLWAFYALLNGQTAEPVKPIGFVE